MALASPKQRTNRELAIKWLAYLLDVGTLKIGEPIEYGVGRNHPNKIKRYFSCVEFIDFIILLQCSFYLDLNPVKNRKLLYGFLTSDAKSLFDYNIETNF